MPAAPLAQGGPDDRDDGAAGDHLNRRGDVRADLCRMALRVYGAERPRAAREGERQRTAQVGLEYLGGRRAHEQCGTEETENQAGDDAPVQIARAARDDRIEERRPDRDRDNEHARDAGGGVLLRPDHERVTTREQEESNDGERAPLDRAARQRIAQRAGHREEQHTGSEEAQPGEEERWELTDAHFDREVRRAPEDADDEIGDQRLALERGHVSQAPSE